MQLIILIIGVKISMLKQLLVELGILQIPKLDKKALYECLSNYNRLDKYKAWYNQENCDPCSSAVSNTFWFPS